jgi:hypothetical protein
MSQTTDTEPQALVDSKEVNGTPDKNEKEVQRVRILLVFVVLLTAVGAWLVYWNTASSELLRFEEHFYDDATKVRFD